MARISLYEYGEEARRLLQMRAYDASISICRHILLRYPKHIRTYQILGEVCLEKGELDEAADIFRRLLAHADPENLTSFAGLGVILEEKGQIDEAIWFTERAFELASSSEDIRNRLRRQYAKRDGVEPPRVKLNKAALARLYARGGQYRQAIEEFRSLLDAEPSRLDLKVALADTLWRDGRREQAHELAGEILSVCPECLRAILLVGVILLEKNRNQEAEEILAGARGMDPENRIAYALFGEHSPLAVQGVYVPRLDDSELESVMVPPAPEAGSDELVGDVPVEPEQFADVDESLAEASAESSEDLTTESELSAERREAAAVSETIESSEAVLEPDRTAAIEEPLATARSEEPPVGVVAEVGSDEEDSRTGPVPETAEATGEPTTKELLLGPSLGEATGQVGQTELEPSLMAALVDESADEAPHALVVSAPLATDTASLAESDEGLLSEMDESAVVACSECDDNVSSDDLAKDSEPEDWTERVETTTEVADDDEVAVELEIAPVDSSSRQLTAPPLPELASTAVTVQEDAEEPCALSVSSVVPSVSEMSAMGDAGDELAEVTPKEPSSLVEIERYRLQLEQKPKDEQSRLALARAYRDQEQVKLALEQYTVLLRGRSKVLPQLVEDLESLVASRPDNLEAHELLADMYGRNGQLQKAVERYRWILQRLDQRSA